MQRNLKPVAAGMISAMAALSPAAGWADDPGASKKFFEQHSKAFGAGDIERLLADYSDDAVIIMQSGTLTGKEQIRGLFKKFVAEFNHPDTKFEMLHQAFEGPIVHIVWKAETTANVYDHASETFVLRDGKIAFQTVTLDALPK